jgi:hypothetical protein
MVHPAGLVKLSIGNRFSMQLLVSEARQYTSTNSITKPSGCFVRPYGTRGAALRKRAELQFRLILLAVPVLLALARLASGQEALPPKNNYPTAARADYVIGCLAANGFQRQLLDKCACGIDVIANRMSYDDYETANTVLSMQQASVGPRGGLFRDTPVARSSLEELRRAQAEANLRCGN